MTKNIPHRRRKEKKTDYKQRLKLLKSGEKRLVVRKHLNDTITQIVQWKKGGDETLLQVDGKQLQNLGWKGHCGNLPSAYLIGYLLGIKAKGKEIEKIILDTGLQESTKENRIYAAVMGVKDAGVNVPCGSSVLPSEERIKGKHIENYASKMNKKEKEKQFSNLIQKDLDPENISEHFEKIKEKIKEEFGE